MSEKASHTPNSQVSTIVTEDTECTAQHSRAEPVKNETSTSSRRRRFSAKGLLSHGTSICSLRLENSGSVARDHLALERTFLAYVRTSLTIASAGVVLVQLFAVSAKTPSLSHASLKIQRLAPALGATIIAFAIAVLILGCVRFFSVQFALVKGKFPVARIIIGSISIALAVLVTIIFGLLIAGRQ